MSKRAVLLTFLITLTYCSALFAQGSKQKLSNEIIPWIKFNWVGDSLGNHYYDKAYINIPVKVGNMPYQFDAQFDLGAFATILYGKAITNYIPLAPELKESGDTLRIKGRKFPLLKNVTLHLDQVVFPNLTLVKLPGFGKEIPVDSIQTKRVKHIGTIGVDLCANKVLIIDYPNQRISIIDSLPKSISVKASFLPARFNKDDRVMIPFKIGEKTEYLMFDTGSSTFPILTFPKYAMRITDSEEAVTDSLGVSSWGVIHQMYKKRMNKKMYLGNKRVSSEYVFYSDKAASSQKVFDDNGIFGFTGNVLFLDKILIIDFKNRKFGLL
jgi:hypothetical protein